MKVDLYTPNPTRCFQCQKFGHGKQSFRSQAKCYRCSDNDYDGLTCDKPIKCTNNCNLDDMSSSQECPVYLTEKQIKKITVEKNISYFDAGRQVTVSNDSQPTSKTSCAGAARRQYTSAETQTTLAWPPASDAPFKLPIPSTDVIIQHHIKQNLLHQQVKPTLHLLTNLHPHNQVHLLEHQQKLIPNHQHYLDLSYKNMIRGQNSQPKIITKSNKIQIV